MMRTQRKAAPLVALLAFELGAIAVLTAMGKAEGMGIPWSELSGWLASTSGTDIAAPVVRLLALGVAYWMLISTALFAIAQLSQIPAAIRATSRFTLPSVRRVVDGAVVVSLATTTLVGFGVGPASAATSSDSANIITAGDLSVKSPTPGAAVGQDEVVGTSSTTSSTTSTTSTTAAPVTSPGLGGNLGLSGGDTSDSNQSANATTTTSTTAAPTTTTTAAPSTTTSTTGAPTTTTTVAADTESAGGQAPDSSVTPIAPSAGNNSVRTPRPGAPATTTTTTTVAPAPTPAPQTEVAGVQDHRVVKGENFWTIARATVAEQGGKEAKDVTESEVRDYWLKLVAENKDNIRSGDPHWIFPGETVKLPAVK